MYVFIIMSMRDENLVMKAYACSYDALFCVCVCNLYMFSGII